MAGPLAEATADIRLSDGRFNTDLATILAKLRAAVTQMELQSKVDLTATIKVDDTAAKATVAALHEEAATAPLTTTVNVDDSAARATLAAFHQEATAVDQISVQIDAHTAGLEAARDELVNLALLADSLTDKRVTIDAALRDEEAISTALHLQELLTELGSEDVIVTADVNATQAFASITALTLELDKLDARNVNVNVSAEGVAAAGAQVEAADAAAGAAASDSGGFGRLALRLGFFGVAGVAAIGALGAKITQMGVTSAAALESTVASFTNILGSADAAKTLFGQLEAFSIPSPFDTETLATTARQLLAIGVSADQVVPDVKTLSAVVAELGNSDPQAFGRLTLALGQIGSSVRPLTQDVRQITSAIPGFNAQVELAAGAAQRWGTDTATAQKRIADGGLSGSAAMQILLEQMKAFPGAAGAISSAADTLTGKLSSFKDTVKLDLVGAFSGVTVQIKEALDPLSHSVDDALKAIGPGLASAVSNLIPAIGPFIEQLGAGLAPAFSGIFTGLGGVLQGLAPVLSAVLPVVGELATTFGELAQAVGPSVATTAGLLGTTLVPVLNALADALEAIPTGVLSTLLTGFLAFKGIGALSGLFDNLALSMQKSSLAAVGLGQSANELGAATGKFAGYAQNAQSAAIGLFTGIGSASDNALTKVISFSGALGSIGAQLATGNEVGAAITAGTFLVGNLVGEFERGQKQAKLFQTAVSDLARTIKTELNLKPGDTINLTELVNTAGFAEKINDTLSKVSPTFQKDLLSRLDIRTGDIQAALTGTEEQFQAFVDKVNQIPTKNIAGLSLATAALGGLREEARRSLDATQTSLDANTTSAQLYGQALQRLNAQYDNIHGPAIAFNETLDQSINSVDANTKALAAQAPAAQSLTDQYQTMASALFGLSPAFAQFAQSLDVTPALDRVKQSASDLKDTFTNLTSALSQSIASQNLQAQLNSLSMSLDQVIGQSAFDSAKAKSESISTQIQDQESRIADLQASLAQAQAKALQDAADLDVRIADARKFGSVTGLAALEAARANVGDAAAKAQRDLDKAERQIGDLQDQLAGIDVQTPQRLIDIVKGQAKTAGVDLWTFLLQGPTAEARQLYQQDLAAVVNSAFSNIQSVDDKQGPQAALDLLGSIQSKLHDQLIAGGLSPGTADEIVQNMLHPAELTKSLTDELNANLAAATDAANAAGHTVDVGLTTTDIEKFLSDLQDKLSKAPPVSVPFTFNFSQTNPLTPPAPDFADLDKQFATHAAGLQNTLAALVGSIPPFNVTPDFADADKQLATHFAPLGAQVDPDFADADKQMATHGAPLSAVVAPDFADADKQLATHDAPVKTVVRPDTSLLDQIFAQPHTVTVTVVPDFADLDKQLFLHQTGLVVPAAEGGIFEFFRRGGFSGRDAAHVAQIAPAGAWRVWAEPETGGEGYVPLALAKRDRSTEIVRTIADMFGYRLEPKIDINPTIDIFPAVSPIVNLHPSFTVPPSLMPPSPDVGMYLTLPHALTSIVQSLMPPSPSRPAVTSVAHMTGWTTALPAPSWDRLVSGDTKIPDLAAFANSPTVISVPGLTAMRDRSRSTTSVVESLQRMLHSAADLPGPLRLMVEHDRSTSRRSTRATGERPAVPHSLVSPWSVPSMFEHDIPAFPSPVGSQLVVWGSVPQQVPPPGTAGGPAQLSQVTALFGTQPTHVAPILNPDLAVQVTTSPNGELLQAIRELTAMMRSGSPHSERLARAESIARHIHVHEGAITLTSDNPRQSARELVDELTRMAY